MAPRPIVLVAALALLAACGSPTIDTTNPETTEASITKIQSKLSDGEREQFSAALGVVIANALGGGYKDVGDTPEGRKRVREALRGKTAKDIIADAERIKQEAAAGQKTS